MTAVASDLADAARRTRTLRNFDQLAATVGSGDPMWLAELRAAARERFAAVGLPGSRDEEWRFTPLTGLPGIAFEPNPVADAPFDVNEIGVLAIAGPDTPRIVMVDGRVRQDLSRLHGVPAGVTFGSLAHAIAARNPVIERNLMRHATIESSPFTAVNGALMGDGAFLHVQAGTVLPLPLEILHLTTGGPSSRILPPRILVVVDADAQATIAESYAGVAGDAPQLVVPCAEIVVGRGARLEHVRLQREAGSAWHVGFTAVTQEEGSHYRSFVLARGGHLSRHNLHARLAAPRIETLLYGLYLGRDDQVVDNHTAIFHDEPHCNSWEVYKGVLAGRAHGVFNGKVVVQPVAQRTDAKQTNRNLLLSNRARIDTKPQLEIFADDVKCTHGATVGRLDEAQRFYLRARGIAGREAELLLVTAFVAEVVMEITTPAIRAAVETIVRAEMDGLIG
ncbi:MAG TPA: Fe-S cluster assembly protein SufD [Gemmatimonadales bacterium]|jgi:Fe-S cluster assembly protein SufD